MENRARARELAAEYLEKADPTGWFEELYREAERGTSSIPWADLRPNPNLSDFWERHPFPASEKRALVIGCGLGDDAEQLSAWGFRTTAFDIAPSAIHACKRRFPGSDVTYTVADLLNPPHQWLNSFEFVLEAYTLQVLPRQLRPRAVRCIADVTHEGGHLLVIARAREEHEPEGQMPWPLTRLDLERFRESGVQELRFEDYFDRESPPVRRFRAFYQKSGKV